MAREIVNILYCNSMAATNPFTIEIKNGGVFEYVYNDFGKWYQDPQNRILLNNFVSNNKPYNGTLLEFRKVLPGPFRNDVIVNL